METVKLKRPRHCGRKGCTKGLIQKGETAIIDDKIAYHLKCHGKSPTISGRYKLRASSTASSRIKGWHLPKKDTTTQHRE